VLCAAFLEDTPTLKFTMKATLIQWLRMPDNSIDLTVTSPPYDDLRNYNGYSFDFENVAKELLE
jgi:hypothetical protein